MYDIRAVSAGIRNALGTYFMGDQEVIVLLDRGAWTSLTADVPLHLIRTEDLVGDGPNANGLFIGGVRYRLRDGQ